MRPAVRSLIRWLSTAGVLAMPLLLWSRPVEVEDLFRLKEVSDPQLSPDGSQVAYVVTSVVRAENRTQSDIWMVPAAGGEARPLVESPHQDCHPRWSPDGRWIVFASDREGEFQVFAVPTAGGPATRLTRMATGATQPVWAPAGNRVAFVSAVFPEFSARPWMESDRLNRDNLAGREVGQAGAHVATQLPVRREDAWRDGRRRHLFVVPVTSSATGLVAGDPRDVTPGDNDAVAVSSAFAQGDDFDLSPDGRELAYTVPPAVAREQAWSTNHDVWTVDLESGERRQATDNPAADAHPRYSPDGKYLAYRAQSRPGFAGDRWQLRLLARATGEDFSLTAGFDATVADFRWDPRSESLLVASEDAGKQSIYEVDVRGGEVRRRVTDGSNTAMSRSPDGRHVVYLHSSFVEPAEVWRSDLTSGEAQQLTQANAALLAPLDLVPPEQVAVRSADGTVVTMWIVLPPNFNPARRYPLVFWVHGGPQAAFNDAWSASWNPAVWAAQGYVVALPNPRGSTGFGQDFANAVSRNWGGKPYDDLLAALAYLEQKPWIDPLRMAAAGTDYGGYMVNWFQGHTPKFRALVTDGGIYDFTSLYGLTDELWLDEWEHGIPWENAGFDEYSPHRFAGEFKTPQLIIHGELNSRVPPQQGQMLFTTLQRQGVPAKLLCFPDEGRQVLKPRNRETWHRTIFEWLAGYLRPAGNR